MLTKSKLIIALGIILAGWLAATLPAHALSTPWQQTDFVSVRLISGVAGTGDEKNIPLGLHVKLPAGWHSYWRDPGEAGLPPQLDWRGSENIAATNMLYPQPKELISQGIRTLGYEDEVVYLLDITPQQIGTAITARVDLSILTCADICVPSDFKLELFIPAGAATQTAAAALLEQFRAQVPANELPNTPPVTADQNNFHQSKLLYILLLALLGGLILNLMPCVLPVLSLKLLSVVQHAGETQAQIRRGFLASSAGIVVSFWLLAALTIGLQQTGMQLGWGVQFQQPAFLIFLIIVLLLFAANLFGWFEFTTPRWLQQKFGGPVAAALGAVPSTRKEFATGMLATLLATPCSAPFLGTAISFALVSQWWVIALVFTCLGIGLALPYLLIAARPALAQKLPRPGRWMLRVRQLLGIALLATAVWLGSVLVPQLTTQPATTSTAQQEILQWQAWAPEIIAAHVAAGKVVFVDITADWCLTCHANKRFVLHRDAVASALNASNIVLMQADWTKPNDAIAAYLKSYGRFGIPFNAVFGPATPEGIVLPELLTPSIVLDALKKAGG